MHIYLSFSLFIHLSFCISFSVCIGCINSDRGEHEVQWKRLNTSLSDGASFSNYAGKQRIDRWDVEVNVVRDI